MNKNRSRLLIEAIKYGLVGFLNTGVTFLVIFILKDLFALSLYKANFFGYIAGLINSFLWNRHWTFKSKGTNIYKQFFLFLIVWGVSYLFQLGVLKMIVDNYQLPDYLSIFIAMVCYTGINFILNKIVTFRNPIIDK